MKPSLPGSCSECIVKTGGTLFWSSERGNCDLLKQAKSLKHDSGELSAMKEQMSIAFVLLF